MTSTLNMTREEPVKSMPGATMQLDRNSGMAQINVDGQSTCFGGEPAIKNYAIENGLSQDDVDRLLALDAEGSGRNQVELKFEGKPLLKGDAFSLKIIFNNLTGLNFQPDRKSASLMIEYEDYLGHMAAELGVDAWHGSLSLHQLDGAELMRHEFEANDDEPATGFRP